MGFYYDGTVGLPDARRIDEVLLRKNGSDSYTFKYIPTGETHENISWVTIIYYINANWLGLGNEGITKECEVLIKEMVDSQQKSLLPPDERVIQ